MAQENNASAQDNEPGTYRDPESGAELTVSMPAGADALARLKWEKVERKTETAKVPEGESTAEATSTPVDDADQVEEQQDNAPGHKSETTDGPAGVPAGDPEKLAKSKK